MGLLDEFYAPDYSKLKRGQFRQDTPKMREYAANVPVDVMRGRLAGLLGMFGDVVNQPSSFMPVRAVQLAMQGVMGQDKYPDTEQFLKTLPLAPAADNPLGRVAGQAGALVPLTPMEIARAARPAVRAATEVGKFVAPKAGQLAEKYMQSMGMMPGIVEQSGRGYKVTPQGQYQVTQPTPAMQTWGGFSSEADYAAYQQAQKNQAERMKSAWTDVQQQDLSKVLPFETGPVSQRDIDYDRLYKAFPGTLVTPSTARTMLEKNMLKASKQEKDLLRKYIDEKGEWIPNTKSRQPTQSLGGPLSQVDNVPPSNVAMQNVGEYNVGLLGDTAGTAKASNLREAEVGRVNRRIGTTGQYVGAPPGVDSPQSLGAMVNNYVKGMEEGLPGRNFYTDSSKDIYARTGQNMTESDLLAQNIATLSRANNVGGNTSMSAKAHIQAATGDPIKTGRFPSKDSPPLQAMYDAGQAEYLGHKRDPFATQLGVEWAPERIGRGVNDMHEAELMGYPSGKVAGATQHDFMDEVRQRAIDKANELSIGGFSDWNTGNAQAAAWTGNKIRRGDLSPGDAARSYADYFPLHEANATYESVSSPVTGHLQGLLDAPFDERLRYTLDPRGSWNTSASGRDIGYTSAGMLPGETAQTVGRFKESANPAFVARPVIGTETTADGSRVMTPGSKKSLTAVEAARAYFDAQEAGAWHRIMPAKSADAYTGAGIDFGRNFTASDMEKIAPLFEARGYYLGSSPNGITVMANDATKTGKDFSKEVKEILKSNKDAFKDAKVEFGTLESDYIDYGGAYTSKVPGSVTSEMLKRLDAAPETAGLLQDSQIYRDTVLARNARDTDAAKAGYGASRKDLENARKIFAKDGWEGLRRAAAAGTVPAAFMYDAVPGELPPWMNR